MKLNHKIFESMNRTFLFTTTFIFLSIGLYSQINLDSGLIAFWPFNENANDESGNGIDGTVYGATLVEDRFGNVNSAYEFDGQDDFISFGSLLQDLYLPLTISAWISKPVHVQHEHMFTSNSQPDYYYGIYFSLNIDRSLQFSYGDSGPVGPYSRRTKNSEIIVPIRTWTHVVATVRGATDMTLYVNGIDAYGYYSGTGGIMVNSNYISKMARTEHTSNFWDGKIDDLRIYDRSLNDEEVLALFNDTVTSIDEIDSKLSQGFDLHQNYPNPFNSFTTISYSLNNEAMVRLKIYDVQGREIKTLVDETQYSGDYQINIEADEFEIGLFFYQLQVGANNSKMMSMLLIR